MQITAKTFNYANKYIIFFFNNQRAENLTGRKAGGVSSGCKPKSELVYSVGCYCPFARAVFIFY
jgi:hypothetical protein